ncbi:hypothetical protein [Actinacidiphila oryziradicis]|uniref:hypothetical protein n=1 Tax=Actinacidiphila oryziradicis TaxID=2571141 RepID=UPI001FE9FB70|nr:hypothetical protein [Actinacidiphila oryziradicis]
MELSKIGPPLNSMTATTSWRRRADSLRGTTRDAGRAPEVAEMVETAEAAEAEAAEVADVTADGTEDTGVPMGVTAVVSVVAVLVLDSWLMELKPPSVVSSSRSCTSPPGVAQDRIYCVRWGCRGKFTTCRYVDMATWREAFDHEAFHSTGPL